MTKGVVRVAVSGAAGNIGYSFLFRLLTGEVFGPHQKLSLRLLESPRAEEAVRGVAMELHDCAFPLIHDLQATANPLVAFQDVDFAILIGAKPRGPGMERADLLGDNKQIFVEQGEALEEVADANARVLVIGNPCNTNCRIALKRAKRLSPDNYFSMMRLDQNRAQSLLAKRAGVPVEQVTDALVWGNHSPTQVPDFFHASIGNKPVVEVIRDEEWLQGAFIERVQQRGAEIIRARGKSSAASAASAIIDMLKDITHPTPKGAFYSIGRYAKGNPYGIDEDLVFGFPCRTTKEGRVEIVEGLAWNEFLEKKIRASEKELREERTMVE